MSEAMTYCGYVAIIGRPNVGKSTLLNHLLGQKISITSRKPQTTRQRILGIKTVDNVQIIYLDTPGLHETETRAAKSASQEVDVVLFVVEGTHWTERDQWALDQIKAITRPVILVINKIDKVKDRITLLPFIEKISEKCKFRSIVPVSAKNGEQVEALEKEIIQWLPESPFFFSPDQVTDLSEQFIVSETIREKLMRILGQEIPYTLTVTILAFAKEKKMIRISAIIWTSKKSQKGIVIGKGGLVLKNIGQQARIDLEKFFKQKVFLQLWVRVKDKENAES